MHTTTDHHQRTVEARERLDRLARLLDSAFNIPGTRIGVGADALLNLIPGAGTLVSKGLSAYLIWEARRLGAPGRLIARMAGNVALDLAISVVPFAGWVGDVFFRANLRNMALLRAHLDERLSHAGGWAEGPTIEGVAVREAVR